MLTTPEEGAQFTTIFKRLKGELMANVSDLLDELSDSANNIAVQAMEHIHSNEVIMTLGYSRTVAAFLQRAAEERNFHVIVAECAPSLQVHNEQDHPSTSKKVSESAMRALKLSSKVASPAASLVLFALCLSLCVYLYLSLCRSFALSVHLSPSLPPGVFSVSLIHSLSISLTFLVHP